jgi:TolB protein
LITISILLSLAALASAAPGEPATLTLAPTSLVIYVGESQQFSATVLDEEGAELDLKPAWSLTGEIGEVDQTGLFTAGPRRASGVVTATLGELTVSAPVSVVPYGYFACHTDGRVVYSVQGGGDGEEDVFIMDRDGLNPINLTLNLAEPPEDYDYSLDHGSFPCWSPDGSLLVYEYLGWPASRLYLMNADGSGRRRLVQPEGLACYRPTFSTDGKRILFDARPFLDENTKGPGDIYIMDLDGGNLTKLTTDPLDEEDACFSPDGKQIAYVKQQEMEFGYKGELWVMDADGKNARRLTPVSEDDVHHPAWSPDGTTLACTICKGSAQSGDIGIVSVKDGRLTNLTENLDGDEYGPFWTWDGSHILYATTDAPGLVLELWSIEPKASATPALLTNRPDDGNHFRCYGYQY